MVKSLEARDPYTSGHSRRVQHYSMIIARALGLSERQIEEIGRAALLHDVGKITRSTRRYLPSKTNSRRMSGQLFRTIQWTAQTSSRQ